MSRLPEPMACYRHYKGDTYQVISLTVDTETAEYRVVYKALTGSDTTTIWDRPSSMWFEKVMYKNTVHTRFTRIECDN